MTSENRVTARTYLTRRSSRMFWACLILRNGMLYLTARPKHRLNLTLGLAWEGVDLFRADAMSPGLTGGTQRTRTRFEQDLDCLQLLTAFDGIETTATRFS